MKLPAVAITATFSLGIALGQSPYVARHASSHRFVAFLFAAGAASLLASSFLAWFKKFAPAAVACLTCWALLGVTGVVLEQQPSRPDHILQLASASKVDLKSPLRYFGHLRDEPANLPWGVEYELCLSSVESQGTVVPASGGLRISYVRHVSKKTEEMATEQTAETFPVSLHAGDSVAVLAQARLPGVYRDEGAFDRRAFLSQQNVDVVATLRAAELLQLITRAQPGLQPWLASARRHLRERIDSLFPTQPEVVGVLRAMLLGDRSLLDREESVDFQKAGAFHVLVVAGLHVSAMAVLLYWIGRRVRLPSLWTTAITLLLLYGYLSMLELRAPVWRAVLMATVVMLGRFFYRRLDLLNSVAVAALVVLLARPLMLGDPSFQLSFLAIACIGGLALPWLDCTSEPYMRALSGWRDSARDCSCPPRAAQFRLDLRSLAKSIERRVPARMGKVAGSFPVAVLYFGFRIWQLFILSCALQLGMLPLLVGQFHRVTLAAPLANFAAIPLTGLMVPLGFLTLLSSFLFAPLGKILALPLSWLTLMLIHIVQWCAHIKHLNYRIPGPAIWITVTFFGTLAMIMVCLRIDFRLRQPALNGLCVILAAGTVVVATSPFAPRTSRGRLEVNVLDVGQGDSLFLVSPAGKTMLIDGGGAFAGFPGQAQQHGSDPGEEAVSPFLWSRGFKQIDIVALTHAHQDHAGGLLAVLENFRIGKLWIGRDVSTPALVNLTALAREKNIPIEHEVRGTEFVLDGVAGQFLWPVASKENPSTAAKNNDSLVLHLQYGRRSLLLPGDAEKQAERTILGENAPEILRADVLKIGHHGSKNSTTEEFLSAVHPRLAVISAGENNPYGHPSPELLERLGHAGVRILRTDRDGAIRITTDGDTLEISCFIACPERQSVASTSAQIPDQNKNPQQQ